MAKSRENQRMERAQALRVRYSAKFCVCGRPKKMREPFCKADMAELGDARAPRPLLRGDLDDPATANAWETCLAVLQQRGYVKPEVTLA